MYLWLFSDAVLPGELMFLRQFMPTYFAGSLNCLSTYLSLLLPPSLSLSRKLNLTDSDTLKWIAQSFILGYFSLRLLIERANYKSQQ